MLESRMKNWALQHKVYESGESFSKHFSGLTNFNFSLFGVQKSCKSATAHYD